MRFLLLFLPALLWSQTIDVVFVVKDGVYNSELIAPLDILEHSRYRDKNHFFRCRVASPEGKPFKTAEGLIIQADLSFAEVDKVDVLVIPSTETSMSSDLTDTIYMSFIKKWGANSKYILTLCDGAFPMCEAGFANKHHVTTFPADQDALKQRYPQIILEKGPWFVHHGKLITSVGGARSYEPALYLTEIMLGQANAKRTAQGLVIEWPDPNIPKKVISNSP